MRIRQRMPQAPAPPPPETPAPVEVGTRYPPKARKLHREERPCKLPGCFVTWTPANQPFCTEHWLMLPWEARGAYDGAYRRKQEDSKRRALTWLLGWLLYFYESNSVTMPPDHKEGWGGKDFVDCPCTACTRIRERARSIAAAA